MRSRILGGIRQFARAGLAATLPRRWYLVHGPRRSGSICLTFDDGPHPDYTPMYLDLLAAQNVKATFFVIGENAERHPELVRRMAAEGHTIGNHTYSHPRREMLSSRQMAEDIHRGAEVIRSICGTPPTLYRPPRGAITIFDFIRLVRSGQSVILWNRDPKDFARTDEREVVEWFQSNPLESGDVVLLHDVHRFSLAALGTVIAKVRQQQMGFSTIRDWTN